MIKISVMMLGLLMVSYAAGSRAGEADAILGEWNTEENKSKVEIYRCENKFCGRITWLKEPNFTPDNDQPDMIGKPKVDNRNPDKSKHMTPLLGLTFLNGFVYAGDNEWEGGTVYDPENGKTYKCVMSLGDAKTLNVRGYIGIPIIGRTTTWVR